MLSAAEPAITQVFDDPRKLAPPAGVENLDGMGTENIASGTGAKSRLLLRVANELDAGSTAKPPIQFVSEPAFGKGRFFRGHIDPASGLRSVGVIVMPDSSDGGLTQLTKFGDGSSTLSGGFDFFFRIAKDWQDAPAGFSLWSWSGLVGLTLIPSRENQALILGVFAPDKVLTTAEKASEKVSRVFGKRLGEVDLANGQVYHAAVLFTTEGGEVSIKLFLQEGTGPIDVAAGDSLHAEIEGLRIESAERLEDDADKFAFELTRADFSQTFDLAQFRLFATPPDVFPGLNP